MRYSNKSRSFQISLALSILLHLGLLAYFYTLPSLLRREKAPITLDFLSMPKEELRLGDQSGGADKKGESDKLKAGKPGAPEAGKPSIPPMSAPARTSSWHAESPIPDTKKEAKTATEHYSLEAPKAPSSPSAKELIPPLDQLANIGKGGGDGEGGEGGKDEETVSLDSTDFKYTSYLHGVKFKIEGVWKYPEAARKSALQGKGVVSFTIQRDGNLGELKLLSSSGYPILDEAILNAIRNAAPFNPMTNNMRIKKLNVVATFEYNMLVQHIWGR